jgi:hypothetical protein
VGLSRIKKILKNPIFSDESPYIISHYKKYSDFAGVNIDKKEAQNKGRFYL